MTVAELLEDPKRWTRHADARTDQGHPCDHDDYRAVCWCINGAALKCYPNRSERQKAFKKLKRSLGLGDLTPVSDFNDTNNHATVLAAVKKAGI